MTYFIDKDVNDLINTYLNDEINSLNIVISDSDKARLFEYTYEKFYKCIRFNIKYTILDYIEKSDSLYTKAGNELYRIASRSDVDTDEPLLELTVNKSCNYKEYFKIEHWFSPSVTDISQTTLLSIEDSLNENLKSKLQDFINIDLSNIIHMGIDELDIELIDPEVY